MKRFKTITVLMTVAALLCATTSAFADDNAFRDTFQTAFYGGAVGALVGAALMVFTDKPADHLNYMGFGAAAGVMAGTAYGLVLGHLGLPAEFPKLAPPRGPPVAGDEDTQVDPRVVLNEGIDAPHAD